MEMNQEKPLWQSAVVILVVLAVFGGLWWWSSMSATSEPEPEVAIDVSAARLVECLGMEKPQYFDYGEIGGFAFVGNNGSLMLRIRPNPPRSEYYTNSFDFDADGVLDAEYVSLGWKKGYADLEKFPEMQKRYENMLRSAVRQICSS